MPRRADAADAARALDRKFPKDPPSQQVLRPFHSGPGAGGASRAASLPRDLRATSLAVACSQEHCLTQRVFRLEADTSISKILMSINKRTGKKERESVCMEAPSAETAGLFLQRAFPQYPEQACGGSRAPGPRTPCRRAQSCHLTGRVSALAQRRCCPHARRLGLHAAALARTPRRLAGGRAGLFQNSRARGVTLDPLPAGSTSDNPQFSQGPTTVSHWTQKCECWDSPTGGAGPM